MDYTIITNRGFSIDIEGGPAVIDFIHQLNSAELLTLPLAGMVLRKSNFKTIVPASELVGAYELHTMDGGVYQTDIIDYDNKAVSDYVNSSRDEFLLIGDIIIQRHNFDMVRLAEPKVK
ncbi:hypothetical protein [Sporosarcina sp. FSL K6-3457]|uniref:hypothetical protein n=1 Tax=Sporosarcina sp. FSL K6-3457 TaxID=2978204 RepID=UPI0030FAFF39